MLKTYLLFYFIEKKLNETLISYVTKKYLFTGGDNSDC